jgi:hypothetical protein
MAEYLKWRILTLTAGLGIREINALLVTLLPDRRQLV